MTPTMTFLQPGPSSAQPVATPGAAAPGQQAPAADFLLMLAQLAGAVAPQPATAMTTPAMPVGVDDMPAEDLPDTDDVMAMLSLSLPLAPIAIQPTVTATTDSSAMMKLAADVLQGKSSVITAQGEVPTELIEADPTATDDSAASFDSMLSPTTMTEAQHVAKAVNEAAAFSRPVHTPVGSAAWADEIGSRLTVMAGQGKHTASLRLSPEHLGPLEIRIAISDDRASVWFGAAHADTRAAIETALPRLRELLESQGLSLTDAGVFREPPRDQPTFATPSSLSVGTSVTGEDASAVVASRIRLGLVDAYA